MSLCVAAVYPHGSTRLTQATQKIVIDKFTRIWYDRENIIRG
jgi:hypothetical protein